MSAVPKNMGADISRFARLEMREVEDLHVVGWARSIDHLRGPTGAVRAGALLTMLDSAGGVCGGLASLPDGWVVSTNMSAHTVDLDPDDHARRITPDRVARDAEGPQQRRDLGRDL